jgi:hypothetical protein
VFRKNARLSLAFLAAVLFAACTDNTLLPPEDVVGTYNLTLFRGVAPPVTDVYQPGQADGLPNGGTVEWTDGSLVLNADGTFTEVDNNIVTPTGAASFQSAFQSSGTFRITGVNFTLNGTDQNGKTIRSQTGTRTATTLAYDESDGAGGSAHFEYSR